MKLYEGSINEFRDDVIMNRIADILSHNYESYYMKKVAASERNSWNVSLNFVKNALDYSKLNENKIIVEYELPYSTRRIDVLLFGKNTSHQENIVLIELKQWSNDNVEDCETEGNILLNYGMGKGEHAHPSLQVEGYHYDLKDFMTVFEGKPTVSLSSCSYCHNYSKLSSPVLYNPKFKRCLNEFPLFSKEDVKALGEYLQERLEGGAGLEVFNRFINSPIRPSKKLLEHTKEMINKQQIFNMIDDQLTAYNSIMHKAKELSKTKQKSVIIVKGGPGTGKSVIALEVMGELLRQKKMVFHATGSSAFTKTLRDILGRRVDKLFKFFFSFTKHKDNEIEVLICDEAHRIRKNSDDYGVPWKLKSKNPQIDDLIRPAKLSLFFIDEFQIVRPKEIGTVELIIFSALKLGVPAANIYEFELKTQFRCSGSDTYLQWVDNILGLRESEYEMLREEDKMKFEIFDSPHKLKAAIDEKNKEKFNCARIVAGFCWPWSPPRQDKSLVNDVVIGDFQMPWERKDSFWKWATKDEGMEQVGTVYTAQGFEFDYIGVIFGKDLVYDKGKGIWISHQESSCDNMVTRNNQDLTKHLKSVYRVLLSRAHKGCFVYFMDEGTEEYFRSKIQNEEDQHEKKDFEILPEIEDRYKYKSYLPVYSLQAACGKFGESTEAKVEGWVKVARKLDKDMFVSQVVGHSMEPRIPANSYCIFKANVVGSRNGKIVLVQSRDINDPDTGGKYTVKRYESKKREVEGEGWEHLQIVLKPENPEFKPIILNAVNTDDIKIIAEFIEIIK